MNDFTSDRIRVLSSPAQTQTTQSSFGLAQNFWYPFRDSLLGVLLSISPETSTALNLPRLMAASPVTYVQRARKRISLREAKIRALAIMASAEQERRDYAIREALLAARLENV